MADKTSIIPAERIENTILFIREHKVIMDADIAALYGVPVKRLNQAVRRNRSRFPEDFMFQLTATEAQNLRSQIVTSSWGGRRYRPFAFTEHGVAMLSSVLKSRKAIEVNIAIVRAFVKLRRILETHKELARQLAEMEKKYDSKFSAVFGAIRELMSHPSKLPPPPKPPSPPSRKIGFADHHPSPPRSADFFSTVMQTHRIFRLT